MLKKNILCFDNTIVELDIMNDSSSFSRDSLMQIIDDNDKLPGIGLMLEKMVSLLREKHGIEIKLLHSSITLQEEVASWKNGVLKIDVRKRGSLGSLFLLSHVFGHLIQYSSNVDYSEIFSVIKGKTPPMNLTDEFKKEYFIFENQAFEFGKTIMEEVFDINEELGILYSSFAYTDFEHYWRYLVKSKTSTEEEFNGVWKNFINGGINDVINASPLLLAFSKEKNSNLSITVV